MKLIVLDPNLNERNGHHLGYDLQIASAAIRRGFRSEIWAHNEYPDEEADGVAIVRRFTSTCYGGRSDDVVSGYYDELIRRNDSIFEDLLKIEPSNLRKDTIIVVPTTSEFHLLGLVRWIKTMDPRTSPTFVIFLMLPSGVALAPEHGNFELVDQLQALFYRLALEEAQTTGPYIEFLASSHEHALEYSFLGRRPISVHPTVMNVEKTEVPAPPQNEILLYAGDAKFEKGFQILPEAVEVVANRLPDWRIVVQANLAAAWDSASAVANRLRELTETLPNFTFIEGFLADEAYQDLLNRVAIMVTPYDPVVYRNKSSGILWEALYLGKFLVVPEGTWLVREAKRLEYPVESFDVFSAQNVAAAAILATERITATQDELIEKSTQYRQQNSVEYLMDQLLRCRVKSEMLGGFQRTSETCRIALETLSGDGWGGWEDVAGVPGRVVKGKFDVILPSVESHHGHALFQLSGHLSPSDLKNVSVTVDGSVCKPLIAKPTATRWAFLIPVDVSPATNSSLKVEFDFGDCLTLYDDITDDPLVLTDVELVPRDLGRIRFGDESDTEGELVFTFGAVVEGGSSDEYAYRLGQFAGGDIFVGDARDLSIHVRILKGSARQMVESFRLSVNGHRLTAQRNRVLGPSDYRFSIPNDLLSGRSHLEFEIRADQPSPESYLYVSRPRLQVRS